jgi:hypothetical protein
MVLADFDTAYERATRRPVRERPNPRLPIRKVWRDQPKPRGKP